MRLASYFLIGLLIGFVLFAATACEHPHHDHPTLACIRHNESRGDYTAQNSVSSASGAYQWVTRTWQTGLADMGRAGEYSRAKYAPASYQDMVAYHMIVSPGRYRSHWSGANRGC